ncbi:hypothetical protein QLG12_15765 [Pseudomonas sp. V88_4]|uniref:hypothetical protein n=1 Tax=Pseudomonas sp. V88_4 TaxID=3044229 RepID=UPI00249DE775|nr:hypothetical protein [Pseudomonas sp. V88_4]MDI3399671.1 hypothetical protein [Pseudomonas sp. V88_4]
MPWYKSGTVSVTQNSSAVIGAGTAFLANGRVGDAFRGPDGNWYEVVNIASDTALAISPSYQGSTATGGVYALAPMQGYVKDSADSLRALMNQFGSVLAVLGNTGTTEGVRAALNLSSSDGLPEGAVNKYMTGSGVRNTTLTGLVVPDPAAISGTDPILTAFGKLQAQASQNAAAAANASKQGVGKEYIEGLRMKWVSANSISVTTGIASIPSGGAPLIVPAAITVSGLTLSASTMYHVYLYSNAGVPAIEVSTTAPVLYSGTARAKSGDTSRRYIGSVLSKTANTLMKFTHAGDRIAYGENLFGAPFLLVSGAVIVAQTVSCLTVVPVTASHLSCLFQNAATDSIARLGNPDLQAPVSSSAHSFFVLAGGSYYCDLPLSSTQSFQWRHDGAASALFNVYANGYLFER